MIFSFYFGWLDHHIYRYDLVHLAVWFLFVPVLCSPFSLNPLYLKLFGHLYITGIISSLNVWIKFCFISFVACELQYIVLIQMLLPNLLCTPLTYKSLLLSDIIPLHVQYKDPYSIMFLFPPRPLCYCFCTFYFAHVVSAPQYIIVIFALDSLFSFNDT